MNSDVLEKIATDIVDGVRVACGGYHCWDYQVYGRIVSYMTHYGKIPRDRVADVINIMVEKLYPYASELLTHEETDMLRSEGRYWIAIKAEPLQTRHK